MLEGALAASPPRRPALASAPLGCSSLPHSLLPFPRRQRWGTCTPSQRSLWAARQLWHGLRWLRNPGAPMRAAQAAAGAAATRAGAAGAAHPAGATRCCSLHPHQWRAKWQWGLCWGRWRGGAALAGAALWGVAPPPLGALWAVLWGAPWGALEGLSEMASWAAATLCPRSPHVARAVALQGVGQLPPPTPTSRLPRARARRCPTPRLHPRSRPLAIGLRLWRTWATRVMAASGGLS